MATPSTADSTDSSGTKTEVKKNLKNDVRAITSISQAFSVCEQLVEDASKLIRNAARVTAKINGQRPRSTASDASKAKNHKSNVSTGALATTCSKIPPRFYMPLKTARYLVAGTLPPENEGGAHKSEFFREMVTKEIRSWRKWHFFLQGLANEVGLYGYAFPTFFDTYDWRPKLIRQDKGFVPVGTELLDSDLPFFAVKWSYNPTELLKLAKSSVDLKGDKGPWKKDVVAEAVNKAATINQKSDRQDVRNFEDTVRQASTGTSYSKGAKKVETYHLFAQETSGKVSHYILWVNGNTSPKDSEADGRLLYEKLDRFDSMEEVTTAMVFQFGNGTIHGSLGAGHILYDMSVQVELTRNESFDNLKMANKIKLQVADGKDINMVKATVLDEKIIVSGAQYAGANASIPTTVESSIALDQQTTKLMEEKVGAFLPPAIIPGTSPTATQVNVQTAREDEIRNSMLDNWLTQFAMLTFMMAKRLCNPKSPHVEAKRLLKKLRERLSDEEIKQLVESCALLNVLEFTEIVTQRRAQFAMSVRNNVYYDQAEVERLICEAAVGTAVAASLMPPKQDQMVTAEAQRQQLLENSAMLDLQDVPIISKDNDFVHMETMKQPLVAQLKLGNLQVAQLGLKHYKAHYDQWVGKKAEPKSQRNPEKKFIRSIEVALESLQKKQQQQQQLNQMQQQKLALLQGGAPQGQPALPDPAAAAAPPQAAAV